jgi:hypothetical protein
MSTSRSPQPWLTAACLALLAAIVEQILHEAVHGVVAVAVGKQWDALHLFAMATRWQGAGNDVADAWVAGSAAVFNIVTGVGAALALRSPRVFATRPLARLWLLYFAAFSILAGFGYLMMDALFYRPGAVGDWKKVIGLLGGGWQVRGPVLAVGAGGVLATFFWIPSASLEFVGTGSGVLRRALALLLGPFILVCATLTLLGAGHPLGLSGFIINAIKYWMGYSAMAWAAFIAAGMAKKHPPAPPRSVLPRRPTLPWLVGLAVVLGLAVWLALPVDPALLAN